MIERILSPFDFVLQMTIEEQCWHAVGVSLFAFCIAAGVRETTKNPTARNIARAFGAGAFALVAGFAIHATQEVEKLNSELMVRNQKLGTEIGREHVLAVTTQNGNKIEFGVSSHGVRNRTTAGGRSGHEFACCPSAEGSGRSKFAAVDMGRNGGTNAVDDGIDDSAKLSEWWRRIWNAADDGAAVSFKASGAIEGESF